MTSSVQPPVLNPSNEWTNKTTSSFDPPSQGTPQNATSGQATGQSPSVTPGTELPGAFPHRGQGEASTDTTNITDIVGNAKLYLPAGVLNTVGNFLGGNNNSNGPAVTTGADKEVRASEHDVYHKKSLPSQELRGALPHEHVGGVGSLPGASIEKSVALLPDEQAEWSECDTFAGRNTPGYQTPSDLRGNATNPSQTVTQKATNLGAAAGIIKPDTPPKQTTEDVGEGYPETLTSGDIAGAQQAVRNIKPVAFDIKQARDVSMPSTETQGQQPGEHTGGVGSLPGPKDEQDVAVLPEERAIKTTEEARPEQRKESGRSEHATKTTEVARPEQREESGDLPEETNKSTGANGVGVGGATDSLKKRTQQKLDEPTIQLKPRVHPLGGDVSRWHGVNLGRGAMEEWERTAALANDLPTEPVTLDRTTAGSEPGQPRSTVDEPENPAGIQRSGGSEDSTEGQRKASLKEKITGGMKVVSGKLGHDRSKVEEGKKLMHGQLT